MLDRFRNKRKDDRCFGCGGQKDVSSSLVIDPKTLKRKYIFGLCTACTDERFPYREQQRLRERRTQHDWQRLTDPLNRGAIRPNELPEQYPGQPREAIRAFVDSGAESAVVPGIDVATLSTSLASLGLKNIYVEQRGHQTVIRRAPEVAAK